MGRRSPKTIGLPLPRSLESNSLEAIQHHFDLYKTALDNMYKFLMSDITTIEITDGGSGGGGSWIYLGDKDTDGSWRIGVSGTDLNMERREGGVWVPKAASTP
jgi:hypothetical protein